jgi:general L-amino acid transport system substrate-binding protein
MLAMVSGCSRFMLKRFLLIVTGVLITGLLASCSDTPEQGPTATVTGYLKVVKDRGQLKCGVSGELPGFSFIDQQGKYSGLDVDICRAIAAAIFDDPNKVEYRSLNAKERFVALQTGEIDVLSRNTTWTLSRETSNKLAFAPVVFYDSQSIMVRKNSGIKTLKDFKGRSICTQSGTTNERNVADQMRKLGVTYTPVVFEDINAAYGAYTQGRCEGVTSDRSQLISRRSKMAKPEDNFILEEPLSKEPLAPATNANDVQWSNVVKWVVYATMEAEELGITSKNLSQFASSADPTVKRFLGTEDALGESLGLSKDFAARAVKYVGNYGEIYDRNLGPKTPLNLPRGQNNLWSKGGLLYPIPFR